MAIRFACPNPECGKPIVVKDEFAGRTGKCPGCQTAVKVPAAAPPPPAFEVVDEPAPKPRPVAKPKSQPVIEVEVDEEPAPKPKAKSGSRPAIEVEVDDEPRPKPKARPKPPSDPVIEVEDEDSPPRPKKKPAAETDDEPRPKKAWGKKPKPAAADDEPAEADPDAVALLARRTWLVREEEGLFSGSTLAGVFESHDSKDPLAVVRNTSRRLLGIFDSIGPFRGRASAEVRVRDKDGPPVMRLEEFLPRFDPPFVARQPARWEVRGPDNRLVGTIALSRKGASGMKMLMGQLYQDEHLLWEADGRPAGAIVMERRNRVIPKRIVLIDTDNEEYGEIGSQAGETAAAMMEETRRTGKAKVKVSVSVMGKGDEEWKGMIGNVHPARAGDDYARTMTFALAVLIEVIGLKPFLGTKTRPSRAADE